MSTRKGTSLRLLLMIAPVAISGFYVYRESALTGQHRLDESVIEDRRAELAVLRAANLDLRRRNSQLAREAAVAQVVDSPAAPHPVRDALHLLESLTALEELAENAPKVRGQVPPVPGLTRILPLDLNQPGVKLSNSFRDLFALADAELEILDRALLEAKRRSAVHPRIAAMKASGAPLEWGSGALQRPGDRDYQFPPDIAKIYADVLGPERYAHFVRLFPTVLVQIRDYAAQGPTE